jgi:N,N'-diacetyllegionaminate synthase
MKDKVDVMVVAEIASAHEGDPDLAIRLAKAALDAGADAVKFQIFQRDNLVASCNHLYDEFGIIQLEFRDWDRVLTEIASGGAQIFVEPFDLESITFSEKMGVVHGYKIPASNIQDKQYLEAISETDGLVHLSVGGATWDEITEALDLLSCESLVLIHGFQNFPTEIDDIELSRIGLLERSFGCSVGYADHTDANEKEMSILIPALAVANGARVIEKHITLDRSLKGRDYYSSLQPEEFAQLVRTIKKVGEIQGWADVWTVSVAEEKYRTFSKRYAVAAQKIQQGAKLASAEISFKRTGGIGIEQADIVSYFGRRLKCSVNEDEPIELENLDD